MLRAKRPGVEPACAAEPGSGRIPLSPRFLFCPVALHPRPESASPVPDDATTPPPLDLDALTAALDGLRLGTPLRYFPALASTNTYAADLAREGAAEGT